MFTLHTKNIQETVTLKDLPTVRQAFFVASLLIVTAFLLAKVVQPSFIYIALLPAGGLMFSAVFGFCPMILFLQMMPWNKK